MKVSPGHTGEVSDHPWRFRLHPSCMKGGKVLDADHAPRRPTGFLGVEVCDGGTTLDVRLVLKTTDDALIGMMYRGIRQGPPDAIARLENGEIVDPGSYYFRMAPTFETAAPHYAWLNNLVGIGIGHRFPEGPIYSIFEAI